ncbi:hypothetical protein BMAA0033 [Burkholderia mallei ATCC 23344]|uniref:Uncharacterized protein n=1 Tax=Burkholderia mallei (strain ATCC 23344) TaxID=243160 RepID=A0A0H2WA93_BURMA|nr:hypothetical protein BMAA0033 [Burkholderia mallei ATCC 23344]
MFDGGCVRAAVAFRRARPRRSRGRLIQPEKEETHVVCRARGADRGCQPVFTARADRRRRRFARCAAHLRDAARGRAMADDPGLSRSAGTALQVREAEHRAQGGTE